MPRLAQDSVPAEILEQGPWLKEHVSDQMSVTEMEILHGVLNRPDLVGFLSSSLARGARPRDAVPTI